MNSLDPRAWAAAAICVLIAAAALGGCSAGQQSQTATMEPAVNGSLATLNNIALRNIRIRAEHRPRRSVPCGGFASRGPKHALCEGCQSVTVRCGVGLVRRRGEWRG